MATSVPAIVEDNDLCNLRDYVTQRWLVVVWTIAATILSAAWILPQLNVAALEWAVQNLDFVSGPIFEGGKLSTKLGWLPVGFEEIFGRVVPAWAVLTGVHLLVDEVCYDPSGDAIALGIIGGWTFGFVEAYGRLGDFPLAIILAPVMMHTVSGTLGMGAVFRTFGDLDFTVKEILFTISSVLIAFAIHLIFNTWIQHQAWFWNWWADNGLIASFVIHGLLTIYVLDRLLNRGIPR